MEFEIYYLIFFYSGERKKARMGDCLEQPLFNAWTRGATPLALHLDEGVASSSMHILPYIYLVSSQGRRGTTRPPSLLNLVFCFLANSI